MIRTDANEQHYVNVGRAAAAIAMVIAVIAAKPFLGGFDSAFQTVQEYSGFIAPGVVSVFLLGMFYKWSNSEGAFTVLILSVLLSIVLKLYAPDLTFVNRIWVVFLLSTAAGIVVSHMSDLDQKKKMDTLWLSAMAILATIYIFSDQEGFTKTLAAGFIAVVTGAILANFVIKDEGKLKLIKLSDVNFATRTSFNVATIAIAIILIALYAVFW